MKQLPEILEPSFSLDDIPDDDEGGYANPPRRSQFKKRGEGGPDRNTGVASTTRRNTIALRQMVYWGAAQRRPDVRTVLQTVVETMWESAIDGDPISQRLLIDVLSPSSAKQLLAHELEAEGGDGLSAVIIRDMTKQHPVDPKEAAANAAARVASAAAKGAKDEGSQAMLEAATAAPDPVEPSEIFDFDGLDEEFEKATKDREPINEWDDNSRDEAARLLNLNPKTVPAPDGPDPRDQRYRPGPKESAAMGESERCVREFFSRVRETKEN